MAADTPTLNRAANQIQSVGAARLSLEEIRELVYELGGAPGPSFGAIAIRMGNRLGFKVFYSGSVDSGPTKFGSVPGRRHEFLFSTDKATRVRVRRQRDFVPIPKCYEKRRPDSGDGAPA